MVPRLVGPATLRERPELAARLGGTIEDTSPEGIAAAVRAMMTRPDATAEVAAFRGPALIVSGSEDALTPPALQEAIHARIPSATYAVIEGAGHLSSLERPADFNAILLRFLHSLPA
jgi:pimeloyl-ACP methyl ester carboxylesterase